MVTAADHANTVREALNWIDDVYGPSKSEALAALDALQAQAETAEKWKQMHALASNDWSAEEDRRKTAEAERDAAVQAAEALHEQLSSARERWAHYYEAHKAAEQAAEQARNALRESALAYHTSNSHPRDFDICTWPQCRIARAALAGNQP